MRLRNPDSDGCTRSKSAGKCEFASEQPSSLSHTKDPKRAACRKLFFSNPSAVIVNFQSQIAVLFVQPHIYLGRVRMPRHIGQCLLEDPKQCRGALFVDDDIALR